MQTAITLSNQDWDMACEAEGIEAGESGQWLLEEVWPEEPDWFETSEGVILW